MLDILPHFSLTHRITDCSVYFRNTYRPTKEGHHDGTTTDGQVRPGHRRRRRPGRPHGRHHVGPTRHPGPAGRAPGGGLGAPPGHRAQRPHHGAAPRLASRRPRPGRRGRRRDVDAGDPDRGCAPPRGGASTSGIPSPQQSSVISPMSPACVPQDHLESVLLEHLASLPSATVRRGVEAVAVRQTPEHVIVTLRDVSSGAQVDVTAAEYVVAADGAEEQDSCGCRDRLRRPRRTHRGRHGGVPRPAVGADGHTTGTGSTPSRTLWAPGSWRLPAPTTDGCSAATSTATCSTTPTRPASSCGTGSGTPQVCLAYPIRIDRFGWFTSAAQMADTFNAGRVYLAGDAAHRVTPRGGTGLNTAVASGRRPRLEAGLGAARVGCRHRSCRPTSATVVRSSPQRDPFSRP